MAFKMKGSPAKLGEIAGTDGHSSALKQAWFGYWGKKSEPVINEDGSVTTSRKNIFTGDVKSTTTKTGKDEYGNVTTDKTTQKTKKDGSKVRVKNVSTNWRDGEKDKTTTKSKFTNYAGTDDYMLTNQSVKSSGGGKQTSNVGGVQGATSGFQDPRIDHTTGEWKDESDPTYPSSYSQAEINQEKDEEGYPTKFYHRGKKKWVKWD